MNRILFEPSERGADGAVRLRGDRARHVALVLKAAPGDTVRAGRIGGPRHDEARLLAVAPDECVLDPGPARPPMPRAGWDLLLALPRPKCLRRLWPQLAALGPERIFLTAAEKVEKAYWGSTFLEPAVYRPLLLDGLAQAGDTILPQVEIRRRLKPFVQDALPALYPPGRRLLAHPGGGAAAPAARGAAAGRGLVAIGPEGGWSDYELRLFEDAGFRRVSFGERVLRTDTAVVWAFAALAGGALGARDADA
ncbi:MAG: 16S rRNA (uracil(1498)-N(3))-methyltransferase [Kiritimatiellae bacterium]|nr:16S rRNA (uracil(1498)-N(3))-methyltransferase [Kiritimatiellia bacterium]